MKRSLAIRLCKLLRERGLSCMMGTEQGEYTVLWWEHDMGEQHRITAKSLLVDQHWMEREVVA